MSDELNPMARAFLESVQDADDPTRADYDRVHGKVKVRLAAGIAAGVAALTTSRAAATVTAKAATATAVATGVAAPSAAIATGKIAAVIAVVAAVGGGTTAVVHYANRTAPTAPVPTAITAPAVTHASPPPAVPRSPLATASPEAKAAPVAPSSTPADVPRAPAPPSVPSAPAIPSAPPVATAASLDAEIALVRDARAALRGGDAARALALLEEHDRRFPGGALTEDCAAERVYALCAMGQVDAARGAAARFLADHPYSPHAASVRASCVSPGGMN